MEKKKNTSTYNAFAVLGAAAIVAMSVFGPNANSRENTVQFLEQHGFKSVAVSDAVWCKDNSGLRRGFSAVNAQGEEVDGKVCSDQIETKPRKMRM
jgi:hypothetical protein